MKKRVKKILAFILAVGIVAPSQAGIVEPVSMVSTVEAATNTLTLNVSNKNIYVGASAKLNVTSLSIMALQKSDLRFDSVTFWDKCSSNNRILSPEPVLTENTSKFVLEISHKVESNNSLNFSSFL